ncbi:beta-propeller fold lactonase family protein [Tropicibacter sp. S64]|uniref:beta-propeller fold lactonase family protein n=1 Tax=Tropicibacter sp. S64 TaxID=3415122 RepID=UPI003C7DD197
MRRARDTLLILTLAAGPLVAGDRAFVTCQNGEVLSVIDVATGEAQTWPLPGKPAGVAVAPDGRVYTVSANSKEVRRMSPSGAVEAVTTLDGGPIGVALDAARGRLFVSDWYNARIWVLDAADLSVLQDLPTGAAPAGLALSPDGRVLASADKDADQVSLFDAETLNFMGREPVGTRPFGLRFAPDGRLFVGNVGSNDVTVLGDDKTTVPVGERPYGIAFAHGRAFVTNQYANTVSVIDLTTLTPLKTIDVGEYPEGIDTTSDGNIAVANWFDNTLSVIDAETLEVIAVHDTGDGPRAFGTFLWGG